MHHDAVIPDISAFGAHGGSVLAFQRAFPEAPLPWYDLSTGVNPFHYPTGDLPEDALRALPEAETLARLRQAAAKAYECDASLIVAAPGTQAIIGLLPYLLRPPRVYVETPTYTGHEESWRGAGIACTARADLMTSTIDPGCTSILCRPNNPDGRRSTLRELQEYAALIAQSRGTLIIDASFADFETTSYAALLENPAVIMLRSFGKTYGLAGLRLGFAMGRHPMMTRLATAFGPWPVHGLALHTGINALEDAAWRLKMADKLTVHAEKLRAMMAHAGFSFVGGTPLFSLFSHPRAGHFWRSFAAKGVATRRFHDKPEWLRLGTPGNAAMFDRLETAINMATS
ncbi:aminotransferase class I/II-fold pyridoxal phosphate-dependent enzyme [Candidatus Kirkpatrickella diaphorinae]|uniref:Aminotransferase n=1 Tax=Candidatus Kirkpatrickella diaphorinae TaxID=2984322 RepID=A0ABY6GGW3_9PROT|nr:aminotransferase class I/II-fold pyridoxal phosphate-dependent enzyme [Candidatus Kirkpatrickella diaphorinae]UYH50737.1 aminotransferase class I/II-fold pyridoxal phosphate-dependent enzyme [Candidatus Kirkpatrickella diaphorinae]